MCARVFGGPRIYLPQQILALIIPGDDAVRIRLALGFNAGLGAAIWGTFVLAATCPACAVGTPGLPLSSSSLLLEPLLSGTASLIAFSTLLPARSCRRNFQLR